MIAVPAILKENDMATKRRTTARRNIKKAAVAAKRKKTISHLSKRVKTALGKKGAQAAKRKRTARSGAAP